MVTMIRSDLEFILAQIKIAEADARGEQLLGTYLPNTEIPWGLRRVDGSNNNLLPGQEHFGAADQLFPRGTTPTYVNEGDDGMAFGPPIIDPGTGQPLSIPGVNGPGTGVPLGYVPGPGGNWLSNNDYDVHAENTNANPRAIQPGDVVDADPRTISNLIVDQTANNPAAIFKALQEAGLDNAVAFTEMANVTAAVQAVKDARAAAASSGDVAPFLAALQAAQATETTEIQEAADADAAADAAEANALAAQAAANTAADTAGDLMTAYTTAFNALISLGGVFTVEFVTALLADDLVEAQNAATAAAALQDTATTLAGEATALRATADVEQDEATAATAAVAIAQANYNAAVLAASITDEDVVAAEGALRDMLTGFGITLEESTTGDILKATMFIGNIAPDEGLSAPFNGWMTLFGQFFDHGLDLVAKGGWGTVYVPLQPDDPQYVEGSNTNFMALTRSTVTETAGEDGILVDDLGTLIDESADNIFEPVNLTTPFVDQNQTYTSTPSAQVFHREYEMRFNATLGYDVPVATGRLLNGADGGLATWTDVKAQALALLGIELDDRDIHRIPEVVVDAYGNFIPGPNGFPQIMTAGGPAGAVLNLDGTIATAVDASTALATGHAFLDDIAHHANPGQYDSNPSPVIYVAADQTADTDMLDFNRNGVVDAADVTAAVTAGLLTDANGDSVIDVADLADVNLDGAIDAKDLTADDRNPTTYDDEMLGAHFITGDGRGNENIGLTAVHHVFHAEHNRQVGLIQNLLVSDAQQLIATALTPAEEADAIAFLNEWLLAPMTAVEIMAIDLEVPGAVDAVDWAGERIFQAAKFPTEMQYQHLVFEEFARKVQPLVNIFNDYNAQLNPAILAEFAHTVYRFGHSMLTETVDRLDENWNVIGSGGVAAADAEQIGLIEAFLNPIEFVASGANAEEAAGNIIRGMTRQYGNEIDEFVTEALRNNLVGLPLDLATLNIARGRETGVPTLNEARVEFFAGSGDPAVKPYESWFEFAQNIKNPASVINFIAAYGTHAELQASDVDTLEEKRDIATALVLGGTATINAGTVDERTYTADLADRLDYLNHTGLYAADTNRGGLNDVDFWIGGLAEKKYIFGGFLGSTFNFVFETQLEALQDGDRFYYLSRLANLNMTAQLENNKFSEMIHRNTTATHLPGDAFALPNYFLEADISKQFNYGLGVGVDPTTVDVPIDPFLGGMQGGGTAGLVLRSNVVGTTAGRLEYTGAEHVVLGGTDGNDHLIGGLGDDTLWGDAGDDRLEGGDGNDFIFGGLGNDIVEDEFGINEIRTNEGDDVVTVGTDFNLIITDTGRDAVFGGNGADEMLLGQDDDFADGGAGPDFMIGGEGNDWLESGTENGLMLGDNGDLVQGLPIKRSVDSRIEGHDVLVATGGNADFDAETGDDIMVGGLGTDRFFGQFGFDWATYKNDPYGIEADMNLRLFAPPALPGSPGAILDRYAQTEALSGSAFTDMLRGDDIADLAGGGGDAGAIVAGLDHALLDKNVSLVVGLDEFLGTIDEAGDNRFTGGNILMGGDGSDIIEGRGGNDLIDGDRWLNVRIENTTTGETHDTLAGFKSRLISGEIAVAELQMVREILTADGSNDVDAAEFSGARAEYSITENGDGSFTVSHDLGGAGLGPDGVDRLTNIERAIFADQTIVLVETGINTLATGRPTFDRAPDSTITGDFRVGERLFADAGTMFDADGFDPATVVYFWQVEAVPGTGVFTNILSITADEFAPVTGPAFTLTAAEAGLSLRVLARFQDGDGVIEQLTSLASPIANADGVIPSGPVAGDPAAILGFDLGGAEVDGVVQPLGTAGILEDEPGGFTFTTFDLISGGVGALIGLTDALGAPLGITDPEGDLITITDVALRDIGTDALGNLIFPGTLVPDGLGGFTFTPNANFNGGVTFTFNASDGVNPPVPMEANLDVLPVNDAPVAPTAFTVALIAADAAPRTVTFDDTALLGDLPPDGPGRAIDPIDNERVEIQPGSVALAAGQPGTLVDNLDGTYTYTAAAGFFGDVVINYTIDDLNGLPNSLTLTTTSLAVGRTFNGVLGNADTISGTAARDVLNGNAGVDVLSGLGGDDTISGGAGTDTLNGGDGNDILLGDGAADTINGGNGEDNITGGGGGDTLDGGADDDTFTWNVTDGRDLVLGGTEGLVGDTAVFNGNAQVEVFRVFTRADALAAGLTGLDTTTEIVVTRNTNGVGGAVTNGNIIGELSEIEEIVINTGAGADTVLASGNFDLSQLAFNTITVNDEGEEDSIVDEITSAHNIVLKSNTGPHSDQSMEERNDYDHDEDEHEDEDEDEHEDEGHDDDWHFVDSTDDRVIEGIGQGRDWVVTSLCHYQLDAGQEIEGLVTTDTEGTANLVLIGNEFDNSIAGNAGHNSLFTGGGTHNILYGFEGDDWYFIESANDTVFEAVGEGRDWVVTTVSYKLGTGQEIEGLVTDDINGTAPLALTGNEFDNSIAGNAGDNVLSTGGGTHNVLYGFAGNDTFHIGSSNDTAFEAVGQGTDLVVTSASYKLGAGQEIEQLTTADAAGTSNLSLTGNEFDNLIAGNAGDNIIDGSFGDDILTGGTGGDTFIYGENYGADSITDFEVGSDIIELLQGLDPVQAIDTAQGLVFDFGNGNTLTLHGLHDTSLNPFG